MCGEALSFEDGCYLHCKIRQNYFLLGAENEVVIVLATSIILALNALLSHILGYQKTATSLLHIHHA